MSLLPGSSLGGYEILGPLGSGGMGDVYRARDIRLKREVAIKILPPAFAADADRLARFQREAEVLASLNHPHIAAIYGIEESNGRKALVLELVEGETLAERIAREPLKVDEALDIAKQIATALEAAHETGIVHRDLKPANIKITPSGTVKVLDFGLAKLSEPPPIAPNPGPVSVSPTITSPALTTAAGMILGTAAYMSPEQARGFGVDKRTDIWALGCILFEMLAGVRAFRGETVPDVIASVLTSEPDYSALPQVGGHLRAPLERALEKDPKKRWRDIGDLRVELEQRASPPNAGALAAVAGIGARERSMWTLALLATAVSAALVTRAWGPVSEAARPLGVVKFGLTPNSGTSLYTGGWIVPFALSPDGRWLAYTATSQDGQSRLWLRPLDAETAQSIGGSERATSPFWSPDSTWIGFQADNQLHRVGVPGGTPEAITRLKSYTGGATRFAWGDGVILFSARDGGILRVPAQGGPSEPVTTIDPAAGERAHLSPEFLSNGRDFLYVSVGKTTRLMRQSLEGDRPSMVAQLAAATNIRLAGGHLFFVENGVLWSQRFDEAAGRLAGERRRIAAGIPSGGPGTAPFSSSASMVAYWRQSAIQQSSELRWVDRQGNAGATVSHRAVYDGFDVSPDGSQLVTAEGAQDGPEIWITHLTSGGRVPLRVPPRSTVPLWAPDNRHVAFLNGGSLHYIDVERPGDGTVQLTPESRNQLAQDWTSSGGQLLFEDWNAQGGVDIAVFDATTKRVDRLPLNTESNEFGARLSPNDQWLLYVTDQSGRPEVWIAAYPSGDKKRQISPSGGTHPSWRDDGREVYFISADGQLVATSLEFDASKVTVGRSTNLFRLPERAT